MRESSNATVSFPAVGAQDVLTSILRDGAQRLLTQAIEAEVAEWIEKHRQGQGGACHRRGGRDRPPPLHPPSTAGAGGRAVPGEGGGPPPPSPSEAPGGGPHSAQAAGQGPPGANDPLNEFGLG